MTRNPAPPVAAQRPYSYEHHGVTIEDPYHWMRDQSYPKVDDPEVLDYLKAENAYFEAMMAPHAELVETLFQEMKGRIKEDDRSRSEEHTSELQSLMRSSYAVFCLKKKKTPTK